MRSLCCLLPFLVVVTSHFLSYWSNSIHVSVWIRLISEVEVVVRWRMRAIDILRESCVDCISMWGRAICILNVGSLRLREFIWIVYHVIIIVGGWMHPTKVECTSHQTLLPVWSCLLESIAIALHVRVSRGQPCSIVAIHYAIFNGMILRHYFVVFLFGKDLFWRVLNWVVKLTVTISDRVNLISWGLEKPFSDTRYPFSLLQVCTFLSILGQFDKVTIHVDNSLNMISFSLVFVAVNILLHLKACK